MNTDYDWDNYRNIDLNELIIEAEKSISQNNISNAKLWYIKAIKLSPKDPNLHNSLGLLEMSSGLYVKAQKCFELAIKNAPEISRFHCNLGDSFLRMENSETAISHYNNSTDLDYKNSSAWNNKGFAYFRLGVWDKAISCYGKSIESRPDYSVAWYNYGYTLQLSGQLNEAEPYYKKAIELNPKDKIALNNLANVHYNQGFYELSIDGYEKSLEIDSEYVVAINNIGNALDHLGKFEEALQYHKKSLDLDPTFHYALMAAGRALTKLNRATEGIELIESAIEIEPNDPDYYEALGRCLIDLERLNEAREAFNQGLIIDNKHVLCWVALGDVNSLLNNSHISLQCYDEAIMYQDSFARSRLRDLDWLSKTDIIFKAGRSDEGFRQYHNAVAVSSDLSIPFIHLAEAALRIDNKEQAKLSLEKAIEANPYSLKAKLLLSDTLDTSEAISYLYDIIDNQTTDSSNETDLTIIHRKLGLLLSTKRPNDALEFLSSEDEEQIIAQYRCYSTLSDWKKAKSCSDKLLDSNSKNLTGWLLSGWASFKNQDYTEAQKSFEAALAASPDNNESLLGLISTLEKSNQETSHLTSILDF